jgi:hypothetical protein
MRIIVSRDFALLVGVLSLVAIAVALVAIAVQRGAL